jgi:SAM-dependent methyltransferase
MPLNRNAIAEGLRRAHLVDLAYRAAVALDVARNFRRNRRFRREHPDFAFPPAHLVFLTLGTTSYENYHLTGQDLAHWVTALGARACPTDVRRICEWGCGTGKTVRHLARLDPQIRVYGTDYDPRVVRWCAANIPNAMFSRNQLEPPLPFEDDFFDLLFSFSVYTHLPPDLQFRWLGEQLRIVRPGGLVSLSVHGDAYQHRLTPEERLQYRSEGVVVHGSTWEGGPWFTSFNSPRWMEHELLRGHEIVHREIHPPGADNQDRWIIRKPLVDEPA